MACSGVAELLQVLEDARAMLARPENEFAWSTWKNAVDALRELDALIAALQSGQLPRKLDLEMLFDPTGDIQEVSLSSGWAESFLALAARFDAALARAYANVRPPAADDER